MKMCRLQVSNKKTIDEAWQCLDDVGIAVAYSEEDNGLQILHVFNPSEDSFGEFDWIEAKEDYMLPQIDWEAQWQTHGRDFKDGFVHVDLHQFCSIDSLLKLKPGPGFGDLSHPTTLLVLKMLPQHLQEQSVIDIGCGSGILSLAAAAMGAASVLGIDIDEGALKHSEENALINRLQDKCFFMLPEKFKNSEPNREKLFLINMIASEQDVAWQSLPQLHGISAKVLASGILQEERATYLQTAKQRGWQLVDEKEDSGWLGFCFIQAETKRRL